MTKYKAGQVVVNKECYCKGVVITPEHLMKIRPKLILPGDVCVAWYDDGMVYDASTYDEEWLDEYCFMHSKEGELL